MLVGMWSTCIITANSVQLHMGGNLNVIGEFFNGLASIQYAVHYGNICEVNFRGLP